MMSPLRAEIKISVPIGIGLMSDCCIFYSVKIRRVILNTPYPVQNSNRNSIMFMVGRMLVISSHIIFHVYVHLLKHVFFLIIFISFCSYFHIAPRKPTRMKKFKEIRPVVHCDMNVPSRWQTFHRKPRHIFVFTNGNIFVPPAKLIIPRFTLFDWNNVLSMIGEKVHPASGGVRRLYTMDGLLLHNSNDLIDHHYYVASGLEHFKHLPYWETTRISKEDKEKYAEFEKNPRRKKKIRKPRDLEKQQT
uniref:Doublecortin domain-containing protein n=1 Tax=Monodelphis domestica TaxID=13616 RepID=A0A5F8GJT2_MONDO